MMLAHIDRLTVIAIGRDLAVIEPDGTRHEIAVPCYHSGSDLATFSRRPSLRLMFGRFPDGNRVVYIFDPADGYFGYAFNLDAPDCSEWGYAPLPDAEAA